MFRILNWLALLPLVVALFSGSALATRIERQMLDNGIRLILMRDHQSPIVHMEWIVPGGIMAQNADNSLAALSWAMLMEGTVSYDRRELRALERRGGRLSSSAGSRSGTLSASVLREDAPAAFARLASMFREPVFSSERLDVLKQQMQAAIAGRRDDAASYAAEQFDRLLHPDSALGFASEGQPELTAALQPAHLHAYHQRFMQSTQGAVFVLSGDLQPELVRQVRAQLSALPERALPFDHLAYAPGASFVRSLADERAQARILWSYPADRPGEPCYASTKLLATVLGTGMSSRLFESIRERQGLAYSVSAGYGTSLMEPRLRIQMGTDATQARKALEALRRELRRILQEPPDQAELDRARRTLLGRFALARETLSDRAFFLGWYEFMGLDGTEFVRTYPDRIGTVQASEFARCARQLFGRAPSLLVYGTPEPLQIESKEVQP